MKNAGGIVPLLRLQFMKTKGNGKDKVNIVTLGCAKNLVDSEVLMTQLRGNKVDNLALPPQLRKPWEHARR